MVVNLGKWYSHSEIFILFYEYKILIVLTLTCEIMQYSSILLFYVKIYEQRNLDLNLIF